MNRFRKVLCVALVLLLLVASVPAVPVADLGFGITASALDANGSCGDNATYTFDSATGKLVIEGSGKINAKAFYENQEIKEVVIGDRITRIGDDAFGYCESLISVEILDSVTSIGVAAFSGCESLTSVEIPNSVTSIGNWTFMGCYSLTNIKIPDSVTTIGSHAFHDCASLTSVEIGNGLTTIGERAFASCESLTSVEIGYGLTSIGDAAFCYCSNLKDVYYNGSKEEWKKIDIGPTNTGLDSATIHFLTTKPTVVKTGNCGKTATWTLYDNGKLVIEGTGKINAEAFYYNQDIKSVVIGDGITEIGADAFNGCSNLTTLDLGNTVKVIGDSAFYNCNNLVSVDMSDDIIIIDDGAFCGCYNLESIIVGDNVTTIGNAAFFNCDNLETVIISDNVTTIGFQAFDNCENLTSVVIGNGVKTIEGCAFAYCNNLTSVTVGSSVESICYDAFYNCTSLESINIPKTVTYIGERAFRYCPSLTDVYYEGAEENWNAIWIDENNTGLENAEIHFAEIHIHTWDVEETVDYATCTKPGKKIVRCKGAVCEKYEELPMKEHECYRYNVKDVTCTEKGYIEYHCHYCDYSYTEDIEAKGHSYYEKYIEPTCTKNGYTYYYCDNCGDSYTDKEEQAKGHTPDETGNNCVICGEYLGCVHTYSGEKLITKTPTCTEKGQKAIVCSKCKANKPGSEEEIDALGHAWNEGEIIKDATCKEKGSKKFKCNNKCGETKTEEIPVKPHNYKEVITLATCTEDGYSTFTCTMCGSHYVDKPVKAYGHMFKTYFYDEGSATCYQDGTKTAECSNGCGAKNTVVILGSKTDHELTDFTVITPATCTTDGEEEAKCFYHDKCGYSELIPVKALGHDFAEATCIEPKKCKREGCTATEGTPVPHDVEGVEFTKYDDEYHTKKCKVCGVDTTYVKHSFGESVVTKAPTCTYKGIKISTCKSCGAEKKTEIDPIGHDWNEFIIATAPTCTTTGIEYSICKREGCNWEANFEIPALGHDYVNGKCIRCGDYEYGCNHIWGAWVIRTPVTCTESGFRERKCIRCAEISTEEIPALGHDLVEDSYYDPTCEESGFHWQYCSRCGEEVEKELPALGHDYEEVYEKQPTCTEDGYFEYSCTRCGDWYSETVESYGHDFDYIEDFASCTEDGYYEYYCVICGYSESGVIEAYGHTYPDQWSVIIPATCKETGVAVKVCFDCHEVIAMVVPKAGHSDFDGDSKCDTCGGTITVVEPEKPAEKPEEKPCNCDCHAGGIKAFFFKLINFFAKIFDKNARVCDCGKAH